MNDSAEYYDEMDEYEPIEGYCFHCRESVEIEDAMPVWTRRGQPATRGSCPICAGTVFRMGKTELHKEQNRPEAIVLEGESTKRNHPKLARDTVYINYAADDEEAAQRIASDLEKSGLAVWLHDHSAEDVNWSSGVHPALKDCSRMVYVLSSNALGDEQVMNAWQFFRGQRKPIVIAQLEQVDPPDPIRRSPRYDVAGDYKSEFRQMLGMLSA
ncbi:toll/interleukin-1 receptor domain-containing protein [Phototrophicus methaneseepsis]|uniref:Toll/interleukin-1 receptor domain-containing protein n=1 Tax=Phototrophicus methaneseepsis TaxID=2710758 RepID=A0A7S8ECF3_9CHLR|nr:TIR domain-containing protein [Phototrophicus methaneseepsis]QPC84408.1 toll/interleukin-1 receptor domain-containing protein [Phototrophicus methaneseepsis]